MHVRFDAYELTDDDNSFIYEVCALLSSPGGPVDQQSFLFVYQ
jgi:hypothetical protein